MRRGVFVSIVAIISLLVHAGALARHDFLMLAQAAEVKDPLLGEVVICHSGALAEQSEGSNPFLPKLPDPQKASCPLCFGLGPLAAVLASATGEAGLRDTLYVQYVSAPRSVAVLGHSVDVPPSRGPPSLNA